MVQISTVLGCILVIAATSLTEIHAQNGIWAGIMNKRYYFEDPLILMNSYDAEQFCQTFTPGFPMKLVGFETIPEWTDVTNFQDSVGWYGKFRTSGEYVAGTSSPAFWEWGVGTGPSVDDTDFRWTPGSPTNSMNNWPYESIIYFIGGVQNWWEWDLMYHDDLYSVVCEEI